jgi:hypothetical protein
MSTPNCIIKGFIQDFLGSADTGASLNIALCNFGANVPKVSGTGFIVETQLSIPVNPADGTFRFPIWGNDVIVPGPNTTFYQIQFKNKAGGVVQTLLYQFAGSANEQDLSTISAIAIAPVIVPPNAVLTNPTGQQKILGFPLELAAGLVLDGGSAQISVVGGGGSIGGTVIIPQTTGGSDVAVLGALAATLFNKTLVSPSFSGTVPTGLAIASGQVLSADQVMPVNTSGHGGFWSMTIMPPTNEQSGGVNGSPATNNVTCVFEFVLPYTVQIGKVTCRVTTPNAGQTFDVGIYNLSGSKLLSAGGLSGAAGGNVSATFAPVTLPAGIYYMAQAATDTTTLQVVNVTNNLTPAVNNIYSASSRMATAANNATAGVLPTTLGALSGVNGILPICAFFER